MKWYQLWYAATRQLEDEVDSVSARMIQHRIEMFKYLMGESK